MRRSSRPMRATMTIAAIAALTGLTACSSSPTDAGDKTDTAQKTTSKIGITLKSGGSGDTCDIDSTTAHAGPVTFTVTNKNSTAITEVELQSDQRILGEKENLAPGLKPVSFTVTLDGGKYQIYCPNAEKQMQTLTVTGKAAKPTGSTHALLKQGTKGYAKYVSAQVASMKDAAATLEKKIDEGDLAGAKAEYAKARPFYEHIESDVDGFVLPGFKATDNKGNLDYLIDMRASNLDKSAGWHGFHAIERDLYKRGAITDQTKRYAAELTKNATTLVGVAKKLQYKPEDLANGAAALLEEVQSSKIKGEEERYSHLDLVDFAANVEGAQEAFAELKPGLKKIDAGLTKRIAAQFDTVNSMLDAYRDSDATGGYKSYTPALRHKNANKLSQTVQALQDPLSHLAEKVASA
ncbi:iron uptake system protein EfeO [Spelaeicoccus albus]|uniref:Iron uptake system component EfeO n=1 Tax=Spelaeicoccus albus TaxID=1280376 RepID=A0A7Z0D2G3_9MICO|nr:iron uptake system protein EfeO [Spelaeicoccus albus]NYI67644.1 iron uptake system component EfeO [Spelaeicoccus albus]